MQNNELEESDEFLEPKADPLLPCWMTMRMMSDDWSFALLTTTGIAIAVRQIYKVNQAADGSLWLDVHLIDASNAASFAKDVPFPLFGAPTDRTAATINAQQIVAAFELADT